MDNRFNEELSNIEKIMHNNQDDIAIINGKIHRISELRALNSNQLYEILQVKPGMKLYKYCPFDQYTIDNIEKNQVHLSNPDNFDDAFDSRSDIGEEGFKKYRVEMYLDTLKVKYLKEDKLDKLVFLLFESLGRIANTYDEFKVWLSNNISNTILLLRLEGMYLRIITNPNDSIKNIYDLLHDEYIEYSNHFSQYRISCFSTNPINLKMWSLYANNNRGICIEYTW